jgi:hypothetical protein
MQGTALLLLTNGTAEYRRLKLKLVTPLSELATFCILAESFGRFKGSRYKYNKTVSVSIGQDVFRTDVGWPCVIPSGTVHSGRRWSQNKIKSACRAAHTSSTALELHRSPTVPRRLRLLYNPFTIVQCLPSNNKKHHLQRSPICSKMTDSPKPSESGIFSTKLFHPIG